MEPTATATVVPTEVPTEVPTGGPTEVPREEATEEANEQIIEPVDGTVVDAGNDVTQEDRPASIDRTPETSTENDITPEATEEQSLPGVIEPVNGDQPAEDDSEGETPEVEATAESDDPRDQPPEDNATADTPAGDADVTTEEQEGIIEPIDGADGSEGTQDTGDDAAGHDGAAEDGETPEDGEADGNDDSGSENDDSQGEDSIIEPIDGSEATQNTGDGTAEDDSPDAGNGNGDNSGNGNADDRPGNGNGDDDSPANGTSEDSDPGAGNDNDDNSGPGNGDDDEAEGREGLIVPSDEADATQVAENEDSADDESGDEPAVGGSDATEETGGAPSLGSAAEIGSVNDIPGDPGSRLGVNDNGQLIFSPNPGRVSLESNGLTLEARDVESGQAVFACDASGACEDVTSPTAEGTHTDFPLGWIGPEIIYERIDEAGDVSFRAVQIDSGSLEVIDDRLLDNGGSGLETVLRPYPINGGLLVPARDAWLFISANGVNEVGDNPFGEDISLVRIDPSINTIAYVAGGQIVVASLDSPGTPQAEVAFTGIDFDLSPDGTRIATTDGSTIRILDLDGNEMQTFANEEGIAIGGIAWSDRGIVYVDLTNGVLREIRP
jgi:hypothetical protein